MQEGTSFRNSLKKAGINYKEEHYCLDSPYQNASTYLRYLNQEKRKWAESEVTPISLPGRQHRVEETAIVSVSEVELEDHMLRCEVSDLPAIKVKSEIPV